jgi:RNA polymerase sigma-70 factor (ECF subfamily)
MRDSDDRTVRAVLAGDVDRYAELVEQYQGSAIRLAFSLLGNYEDARDVSQEAFVRAYRSLGRFRGACAFSTWLFRIVINACKDARRQRARRPAIVGRVAAHPPDEEPAGGLFVEVADPGRDPSEEASDRELARQLSQAIGALPFQQRSALVLHHIHGLAIEETAMVMGCRAGTVKSHLFRAARTLRRRLAPWWSDATGALPPRPQPIVAPSEGGL